MTMQKTWRCGTLAMGLILSLSLPAAAGTYYVPPSGDASGTADTAAIQNCLDFCAMSDPGCTIQLDEGQFWIKQLVATEFHGTLKGEGVGETVVSPIPNLPVTYGTEKWTSYPTPAGGGNDYPVLVTFIGGNFKLSDIAFKVLEPIPTAPWLNKQGKVKSHLHSVIHVTGESAHSAIERIHVEGVPAPPPVEYSIFVGVHLTAYSGPWLGGWHSLSSSSFKSIKWAAEAYKLNRANVTIGGAGGGNTFEDCYVCADVCSANRSNVEISHNEVTVRPQGGVAIGLWSGNASERSVYEARHNTIHLPDNWGRGVCIVDASRQGGGDAVLKVIVLNNHVEMGDSPTWQEGISVDSAEKVLIASNTVHAPEFSNGDHWAISAVNVKKGRFLVNDLEGFSNQPKILLKNGTDCLVVTESVFDVLEDGGADNHVNAASE